MEKSPDFHRIYCRGGYSDVTKKRTLLTIVIQLTRQEFQSDTDVRLIRLQLVREEVWKLRSKYL